MPLDPEARCTRKEQHLDADEGCGDRCQDGGSLIEQRDD